MTNAERGTSKCKCGTEHQRNGRYCLSCHAEYMRKWRKTHRLSGEARKKMNCRSYANVYQRKGILKPQPCVVEGCLNKAQKHHEDYSKPLAVIWLCRPHHLERHKKNDPIIPA